MVCKLYLNKVITQNVLIQTVRSRPSMQETRIQSLGWEEPLEKGMVTHSSILAWRISRTEEPGGLESLGLQESDTTERLTLSQILCNIFLLNN